MFTRIFTGWKYFIAALALLLSLHGLTAYAAWGDLDTSFGFQGAAVDPITGYMPRGILIQPDGKILVAGYRSSVFGGTAFFLRRYLSNGSLDTHFGTQGAAIGPEVNTKKSVFRAENIAVLPDGKIGVVGVANGDLAVWQFLANGRADTGFGQGGLLVLTHYSVDPYPYLRPQINVQNGQLLLTLPDGSAPSKPVILLRLTAIGTIDMSFGVSGAVCNGHTGKYGFWNRG